MEAVIAWGGRLQPRCEQLGARKALHWKLLWRQGGGRSKTVLHFSLFPYCPLLSLDSGNSRFWRRSCPARTRWAAILPSDNPPPWLPLPGLAENNLVKLDQCYQQRLIYDLKFVWSVMSLPRLPHTLLRAGGEGEKKRGQVKFFSLCGGPLTCRVCSG